MAGRIKFPFHMRVFMTVLAFCWFLVGVFMILQYHREKEFKQQILDTELQMHNRRIIEDLSKGEEIGHIVNRIESPMDGLRVSMIDADGNLIYDNYEERFSSPVSNHNDRPEIIEARKRGEGNSIERLSESDDLHYFYSARLGDNGLVVRTAVPYTHTFTDFLKADSTLLSIMAALTFLMSFLAFISARKISLSISRLNNFAEKAQNVKVIYEMLQKGDTQNLTVAYVYLNVLQESQEFVTSLRKFLRASGKLNLELSTYRSFSQIAISKHTEEGSDKYESQSIPLNLNFT